MGDRSKIAQERHASKPRHAAVSAALYGVALLFGKGLSFVMLPIVTGALSPAEYGALELIAATADVAGIVLGLGLADALFRFGREPRMAASLLSLGLLVGTLVAAAGLAAAPAIARTEELPVSTDDLRLLVVSLAITATIQIPLAFLRFKDRPGLFALVSVGKAGIQALLVFVFLQAELGLTGILLAGCIVDTGAAMLLVALQTRDTGIAFDRAALRRAMPYALPLVVSGMFGFCLGSFDRWFLALNVSVEEIAHYGLAAKFGLLAAFAMQPFEMWWYPRRLAMTETAEGRTRSVAAVGIGFTWAAFCATGVAAFGPVAIRMITPESYHAAAAWVPWTAAIAFLHTVSNLLNVGCYVGRTSWLPMGVNGVGALCAVAGYLILIPQYGVAGTIAATLLAQSARLSLFFAISQRRVPLPHRAVGMVLVAAIGTAVPLAAVLGGAPLWSMLSPLAVLVAAGLTGLVPLRLSALPGAVPKPLSA